MRDLKSMMWLPLHGSELDSLTSSQFDELKANFGGKAAGLLVLTSQGIDQIRVPPGIGLRSDTVRSAHTDSEALEKLVDEALLPALLEMRREHGGRAKFARLAVRSSGNVEDGEGSGFPGVFATVTDVAPEGRALVDAIRTVLASASKEHVEAYCENQGIPVSSVEMACVLQWQVESALSGVAMTSTNSSVRDQFLLLNFALGACRNVVDGESNNEIVFTKDDPVVPVNADCRDFDGLFWNAHGLFEDSFSANSQASQETLSVLTEVARRCAMVESFDRFSRPMDIEWTVDHDGTIFLLQARPILHKRAIARKLGM